MPAGQEKVHMQALFSGTFWGSPFLLHPATSYQQGESACSVQPSAERLCCGYAGPVLGEGSSGYLQDSGAWKEELRVLLISCQRVTSSEGWSVICPSVCLSLSHTHSQELSRYPWETGTISYTFSCNGSRKLQLSFHTSVHLLLLSHLFSQSFQQL